MNAKSKAAFLYILLASILLALPSVSALAEEKREVIYFYRNYCESCTPEEDFYDYYLSLTGQPLTECSYTAHNVAKTAGMAEYEKAVSAYSIENPSIPMVIVDGRAYSGATEMETSLSKEALAWGTGTDSTVVYLYVPACESCRRAQAVLEALPESIVLKRGAIEIESRVIIEKIDISANPGAAQALFDAYGVADDERITPSVFLNRTYLSGADDIEKSLKDMVSLGWAAGGVKADISAADTSSYAISILGAVGAGLVAGVNTCALSMLLMFLSIVLEARKNARLVTGAFLFSKFVCYLLIGFLLIGVMQRFNPVWLKPLTKILLTVIGGALILLNVWDAWQAHRENYGGVKNQLPVSVRTKLHKAIRALTKKRVLLPASMLLGAVIALGEFLCAGQLYLMQLLKEIETGAGRHALTLIVYCLSFIAPSALLSAVVLSGASSVKVSRFLAEHMGKAKIITAVVMLLMILSAWLM